MPLIEICALPTGDGVDISRVMSTLAVAVADTLACPPEAVWTTWRTLDAYAVGESVANQQPSQTHAPIVHLFHHRPPDAVDRVCAVIEDVLSRELQIATGNVFVTVSPVFVEAKPAQYDS